MKIQQIGQRYLVKGEVGDRYPETFVELAQSQGWRSGSISGIGGVRHVVLAYYDLNSNAYLQLPVEGVVELVSMSGNLSMLAGQPFWHVHAIVGDRSGELRGGHLVGFEVALALECWVEASQTEIVRAHDSNLGLNLLNI